jgi:CRISPR-associated protein Csh1
MIEAIREIGEYSISKEGVDINSPTGFIKIFCEDPHGQSSRQLRVLSIELNKTGDAFSFVRVNDEEFKRKFIPQYLYRFGSANGSNITPTSMITSIEKTYPKKVLKWFSQKFSEAPYTLNPDEIRYINAMFECLNSNETELVNQLTALNEAIKAEKTNAMITLVVTENNNRQYLGDIQVFQKIFVAKSRASLSQKYNTESRAENQVCSVCRSRKNEVFGFVSTYTFYTVDKPGMVSGGFDQSLAWKNYPVCLSCALALEKGKRYLDDYSQFRFYGFNYYVIPRPLIAQSRNDIYETLRIFKEEGGKQKITKDYKKILDDTNDEILGILSQRENSFVCTILIYQANNSEFKIEQAIEDIFPSRLLELFNAKDVIDKSPTLKSFNVPEFKDKKKIKDRQFTFTFECLWHFFGADKNDQNNSSYFLDTVNKIFTGRPVSYPFILRALTRKIRKLFAQDFSTKESALRGLALLSYLHELKVLGEYQDVISMTKPPESITIDATSETNKKADTLFKEFSAFFNTSAKRAIFLEGVLCQKLLKIQYHERKATPFRVKLQGLKLDQRKVQALLPEIQNKLEEYQSNYYRDLEQLIAAYMVQSGDEWRLSKDEISYYFVLGMNLADQFTFGKQDDGGKKE